MTSIAIGLIFIAINTQILQNKYWYQWIKATEIEISLNQFVCRTGFDPVIQMNRLNDYCMGSSPLSKCSMIIDYRCFPAYPVIIRLNRTRLTKNFESRISLSLFVILAIWFGFSFAKFKRSPRPIGFVWIKTLKSKKIWIMN